MSFGRVNKRPALCVLPCMRGRNASFAPLFTLALAAGMLLFAFGLCLARPSHDRSSSAPSRHTELAVEPDDCDGEALASLRELDPVGRGAFGFTTRPPDRQTPRPRSRSGGCLPAPVTRLKIPPSTRDSEPGH
jgi:hypothetical protein